MTSLKEKIIHDNALQIVEKSNIRFSGMDLAAKFWIVNRTLFAINLGLCGLETNVAYNFLKFERVCRNRIILYYLSKLYPGRDVLYPLPELYANIDSDLDIEQINTGMKN